METAVTDQQRDPWTSGYDMGVRHGYETAAAELLHILQERMNAHAYGEDILPLLPLVDELRSRAPRALEPADQQRKQR